MSIIIQKAVELAWKWHKNMKRKGDDSPYIIHPIMVATMLAKNGFSDETIAAGYCHDLLEDTDCSEQEIQDSCGEKVLEIVQVVSNEDLNEWKEKKRGYIESVRNGPVEAKAVCCVDKIHNLQSTLIAYPKYSPEVFWAKFNASRQDKEWFEEEVLKMLKETWGHPLITKYERLFIQVKKIK